MSGATVAGIAVSVGTSLASGAVSNAISGGGGGGSQVTAPAQQSSSSGGTGTAPFQGLSAYNTAGVEPRSSLQGGMGESKEQPTSNGLMPMNDSVPKPEKAATKWQLNSTPSTDPGMEYAQKDESDIWASRLNRYLDYNSRKLG